MGEWQANEPAGFHRMTPLKREATWSSVHGSVTSFGGAGVSEAAGVSMSIASSGVAAAWVLARPPFFLGGMSALFSYLVVIESRRIIKGIAAHGRYDVCRFKN